EYARQIRRYGHEGHADDGSRCAPLPREEWERLSGPLQELARVAEATEAQAGGKRATRAVRPVSATRAAISGRLAMLEELAADLQPRKFEPSYGALPERMKVALAEAAAAIERLATEARAELEKSAGESHGGG